MFGQVVREQHHLTGLASLIVKDDVMKKFMDKCVALRGGEVGKVPHTAVDAMAVLQRLKRDSPQLYRQALAHATDIMHATKQRKDHFPKKLATAELYGDQAPVSSGPQFSGGDVNKFEKSHGDLGVVSRNVIQNDPKLVNWELDAKHVYLPPGYQKPNPKHPTGLWPPGEPVAEPPVKLCEGRTIVGCSFSVETIAIETTPVVKDGKQDGVTLTRSETVKLARKCRRYGVFSSFMAKRPELITRKIDGNYCYLRSVGGAGTLHYRNGDYSEFSCPHDIEMSLEDVGDAWYLLHLGQYKYDNTIGWKLTRHFLKRKNFLIDNKPVMQAPLSGQACDHSSDGIVCHFGMEQYFFRDVISVDLDHATYQCIRLKMPGVDFDQPVPLKGIHEYTYSENQMYYSRPRTDKLFANGIHRIFLALTMQTASNFLDTIEGPISDEE
jgi:hypothetical protein